MLRPRQRSNVAIFVFFVLAALLVTLGLSIGRPVGQGPLSFITAPIQIVLSTIGRSINNLFTTASTLQLTQEVEQLRAERDTLANQMVNLLEYQAEVVEYRRLLEFKNENPTLNVVGADVIGIGNGACRNQPTTGPNIGVCANVIANDTVPYVRYITINRGRIDGIRVGMPVVGGAFALVGRVAEVSETSAQVQLIIDPGSFINVQLVGSRATGTVSGSDDGTLRLQNVLQTEVVSATDVIVTSGLGGLMPRMLTIGQVERVTSSDSDVLKEAIVRPAIDFNKLVVVLVVSSPTSTTIQNTTVVTPAIFLLPTPTPISTTAELSPTFEIIEVITPTN
jgi:rod shape-determining protein MreC